MLLYLSLRALSYKMGSSRITRSGVLVVWAVSLISVNCADIDWKEQDYLANVIPQEALDILPSITIEEKTSTVKDIDVFYREAKPSDLAEPTGQILFLLHGAAFTSSTWQNRIDTIQTMAAIGHHVIAVDLPGSGNSQRGSFGAPGDFLKELIETLAPGQKVVVVSPSYSGTFSLPLLVEHPDVLAGYVPVAPGSATSYREKFANVRVPTLIVVGENDGKGSSEALEAIPTSSRIQVIPRAGHPAYLDDPDRWHQLLFNFMELLNNSE